MPWQQQVPQNAQYMPRQQPPAPYGYSYAPSGASLAPPSVVSRARSVHSGHQPMGVISAQPYEPPDPSLDPWTNAGLTPAQAYQAQVYLNAPQHMQSSPGPSRSPDPPRLGLPADSGRLNIDFANLSGSAVDDGSELPWASGKSCTSVVPSACVPDALPDSPATTCLPSLLLGVADILGNILSTAHRHAQRPVHPLVRHQRLAFLVFHDGTCHPRELSALTSVVRVRPYNSARTGRSPRSKDNAGPCHVHVSCFDALHSSLFSPADTPLERRQELSQFSSRHSQNTHRLSCTFVSSR